MDNKKPSAIDMRLEYNEDKTHVIMEACAEHDYSIKWLIERLYTRSISVVRGLIFMVAEKRKNPATMRLGYNGDKTHVIMEANAEHDYSIKWLIRVFYTRSIEAGVFLMILHKIIFTHISHQSRVSSSSHFSEAVQSQQP